MSPKPLPAPVTHKELPTHQYVMDWNPDFPESIVKERKIPSKAVIVIYSVSQKMFIKDMCSFNPKNITNGSSVDQNTKLPSF